MTALDTLPLFHTATGENSVEPFPLFDLGVHAPRLADGTFDLSDLGSLTDAALTDGHADAVAALRATARTSSRYYDAKLAVRVLAGELRIRAAA